ncbi:protein kinase [Actinomadura graeca]|uniref:Protein kinase n=1 Tax=Actinomadura graeca TaxID=2750812 RepID=A0ABX8R3X1_9ACTN|nr:protein kinase [Actinomadura graeca]QXJ25740.1 protein kinase [Actinomadura graeca]
MRASERVSALEYVGPYVLERRLGSGAQGVVYEAYRRQDRQRVALKLLPGESHDIKGLEGEARALKRVPSFCTARVLDVDLKGPRPYIASEYVEGLNLAQAVLGFGAGGRYRPGARLSGDDLYHLAVGTATALTAIHGVQVVHRDFKPDNILLGPDGPRVIDFGVSRILLTHSGTEFPFAGTPGYIAPELYQGNRGGPAADVFAWGAVIFFAATGCKAFDVPRTPNGDVWMARHPPDLTGLPRALRGLVTASLAVARRDRPLAKEVLSYLIGETETDPARLLAAGKAVAEPLLHRWQPVNPTLEVIAEQAYERLRPEDRAMAHQVLLRFIAIGERNEIAIRRVPAEELELGQEAPGAVHRILREFDQLVSSRDGEVVLARPALPHAWERMHTWIKSDLQGLHVHAQLRSAARAWRQHGRQPSDVLGGTAFRQALEWASAPGRLTTAAERQFLDACAQVQIAIARRNRIVAAVMAVLLVIIAGAAAWAFREQNESGRQRDRAVAGQRAATSRALAARGELLKDAEPATAARLAATAWGVSPTDEARAAVDGLLAAPFRGESRDHTKRVVDVAVSPDGRLVASASFDGTVRVWNRVTGEHVIALRGDAFFDVAFSPDGRTLGAAATTIRLWDVATRRELPDKIPGSSRVVFSPDGRMLATGGAKVTLWDLRSRTAVRSLPAGAGTGTLVFSPDSRIFASGGSPVRLWSTATGQRLNTSPADVLNGEVAFLPDGKHVVLLGQPDAAINDPELHGDKAGIWILDSTTHDITGPFFPPNTANALTLAVSPDGSTIATGDEKGKLYLWDTATAQPLGDPIKAHGEFITGLAFTSDGSTVVSSSYDTVVRAWNAKVRRPVGPAIQEAGIADMTALTSDSILTITQGGQLKTWDGPKGAVKTAALPQPHLDAIELMAVSPDQRTLATGSSPGATSTIFQLWDLPSRRPLTGSITVPNAARFGAMAFSPDSRHLATVGWGGGLTIWDARTGKRTAGPLGRSKSYLAYSADGHTIATANGIDLPTGNHTYDLTIHLWDTRTGRERTPALTGHTGQLTGLAFSPDGATLASSAVDGTVRLWNVTSGKQTGNSLTTSTVPVTAMAFDRNGRTLAVATAITAASSVQLWDLPTRHPLGPPLHEPTDYDTRLTFTTSGDLVSLSYDDPDETDTDTATDPPFSLRYWKTQRLADPITEICRINGSLNSKEWDQYIDSQPYQKACP